MEKTKEFYENQRIAGFTQAITSNENPDYTLPFYTAIFRLMEGYSASLTSEVADLNKRLYNCSVDNAKYMGEISSLKEQLSEANKKYHFGLKTFEEGFQDQKAKLYAQSTLIAELVWALDKINNMDDDSGVEGATYGDTDY